MNWPYFYPTFEFFAGIILELSVFLFLCSMIYLGWPIILNSISVLLPLLLGMPSIVAVFLQLSRAQITVSFVYCSSGLMYPRKYPFL